MIDIAYESFVNSACMELFGSQQKKTNEFNSLSDTELAKNVLLQTLDSYKKRKDNLIKKYHGLNGLLDIMDHKICNYVSNNFSIDINDIDGNYLSIKPFMYSEILIDGKEGDRSTMKSKSPDINLLSPEPILYGFAFDKDTLKKYQKNGLPNFIVLNPWTESLVPIYDNNFGIVCIYSKETGNITDFIMINRDMILNDLHKGNLKTDNEYFKYFTSIAKKR